MGNEMTAGPELDAMVAEKVMGWRWLWSGPAKLWKESGHDIEHTHVPEYSTRISAAWKVVEKMDSMGWHVVMIYKVTNGKKSCAMSHANFPAVSADSDTMPIAINLAALAAVEGSKVK